MKFIRGERAQDGIVVADGEAGRGVYFCPANSRRMVDYYLNGACRVITATPKSNCEIVRLDRGINLSFLLVFAREEIQKTRDTMGAYYQKPSVTRKNIQRFGRIIEDYINKYHPKADAYMVPHDGSGIPTGSQLIVRNMDAFDIKDVVVDGVSQ